MFFGWVPRLHQVVVNFHRVDGTHGGIGVRVGREQDTFSVWEQLPRLLKEFDAGHVRHTLIDDEQGHRLIAEFHLFERLKSGCSRFRAQDAELSAVLLPQVPFDGTQNFGVIIYSQEDRFRSHTLSLYIKPMSPHHNQTLQEVVAHPAARDAVVRATWPCSLLLAEPCGASLDAQQRRCGQYSQVQQSACWQHWQRSMYQAPAAPRVRVESSR